MNFVPSKKSPPPLQKGEIVKEVQIIETIIVKSLPKVMCLVLKQWVSTLNVYFIKTLMLTLWIVSEKLWKMKF